MLATIFSEFTINSEHIISAFVGALLALFSRSISLWIQRRIRMVTEQKLVFSELKDVRRHCLSNLDALNRMDLDHGIPSAIHFHKIKILESSILFSPETFRNINVRHSLLIYRLRIVVNNINIDADSIISYLNKDNINKNVLKAYIDYMKEKLAYASDRLQYELDHINSKEKPKYEGNKRPKYIVYDSITSSHIAYITNVNGINEESKNIYFEEYLSTNESIYKDINDND